MALRSIRKKLGRGRQGFALHPKIKLRHNVIIMENNKKNVFETYNIIADWFFENRYKGLLEKVCLDKLIDITGKGAKVLDLGCGTGIPVMGYLLSQGMQVTGVDGSYRMLDIAKENFPLADFVQADMRELSLRQKYDAIIAWDSFFHLPSEDQPAMFNVFRNHLNDNGVLLFTSGTAHGEAWGMNGGENLFHASLDADQYRSLLEAHDFRVLEYRENDPQCGNATVWMAQLSVG
jgi:SAM-dependent methyltransferase